MSSFRRSAVVVTAVLPMLVSAPLTAAPAQASPWVQEVQRRLNGLGCAAGPVDGAMGTWTHAAVIRFQAANGLTQDGNTGPSTSRLLTGARQVRCDRRPVAGAASGRRIVLSQRQNYVWLVRAGGSVVAQGGLIDNPLVLKRGTYRSGAKCGRSGKIRDNRDASLRLRLHNFVRFAPCGIGFHQVPQYRPSGAQIHSDRLLGTNYRESHGCIRVSRAMSARIWSFATVGTRVVVVR